MSTDYSYLKNEYPSVISLNQLYQILHFSKRKSKWLLENGYIPCIDSGKRTHRFQIQLSSVIDYMSLSETDPSKASVPTGIFSSGYPPKTKVHPILSIPSDLIYDRISEAWEDAPDALTVNDVIILTGYCRKTVNRWLNERCLKYVRTPSSKLIAKSWLIYWMVTYTKQNYSQLSKKHKALIAEKRTTTP